MKLILCSDVHLTNDNPVARLDNIVETGFRKFEYIFQYAKDNGIKYIVAAGDLTHKSRSWIILPKIIEILNRYKEIKVLSLFGQHDMYYYSNNLSSTCLGILMDTGMITILNGHPYSIDDIDIYGCSIEENVPVPMSKSNFNLLVIHKEISNSFIPNVDVTFAKKFLLDHPLYDFILTGDIHKKFIEYNKESIICNTGPMLRREATEDNLSHKPCFFILDFDSMQFDEIIIPHEDAEKVLTRIHIENQEYKDEVLEKFIESIKSNRISGKGLKIDVKNSLIKYLIENNIDNDIRKILEEVMADD